MITSDFLFRCRQFFVFNSVPFFFTIPRGAVKPMVVSKKKNGHFKRTLPFYHGSFTSSPNFNGHFRRKPMMWWWTILRAQFIFEQSHGQAVLKSWRRKSIEIPFGVFTNACAMTHKLSRNLRSSRLLLRSFRGQRPEKRSWNCFLKRKIFRSLTAFTRGFPAGFACVSWGRCQAILWASKRFSRGVICISQP